VSVVRGIPEDCGSSVGIVIGIRARRTRLRGSIPADEKHYSLIHSAQTGSGARVTSYQKVAEGLPREVRSAELEVDHSDLVLLPPPFDFVTWLIRVTLAYTFGKFPPRLLM
jgi:hypothetical protein